MRCLFKKICGLLISTVLIVGFTIECFAEESPTILYEQWNAGLKQYTQELCEEFDVDYSLVLAIIYNESRFHSGLIHKNNNGTNDYGLMQVNEVNFKWLRDNVKIESMYELLDDRIGIRCGVALLAYHTKATGSFRLGLLRYQVGEGAYQKMIKRGRFSNNTYNRVIRYWDEYRDYLNESKQPDVIAEALKTKWGSIKSIKNKSYWFNQLS